MKHFILLTLSVTFFFTGAGRALMGQTNPSSGKEAPVVYVYNFHSTHRCATCNTIERKTMETLDKHFAAEMKSGRIIRKSLNVDEKKNAKIAEKFEAFGTALWVYTTRNGKDSRQDLTDFAFMQARKSDTSFELGLKKAVADALKTP